MSHNKFVHLFLHYLMLGSKPFLMELNKRKWKIELKKKVHKTDNCIKMIP